MEIHLHNLGKRFGSKWLFQNIAYTFETGKIYALSGHNGSGKSTLLKILAGHAKPSKGEIIWKQNKISLENEIIYQKISFTAPYIKLIEDYTLEEIIKFHEMFKPFRKKMSIPKFAESIQLMTEIYNPLNQFSLGMMQRVKLGLALLMQAPLILLDEPTSNLDTNGKSWFFNLLKEVSPQTIIIMASNEQEEIKQAHHELSVNNYSFNTV